MEKIKIGLLGVGAVWEKFHHLVINRLPLHYEITAVYDKDTALAKTIRQELNLPAACVYDDYLTMIRNADIEAVDMMLPVNESYNAAKSVLASGKSLISEKPCATTTKEVKTLSVLAKETRTRLLLSPSAVYDESCQLIKKTLDEKKIGNVLYAIDNNISNYAQDLPLQDANAWDRFLTAAIRHLARQRFLFGNIVKASATAMDSHGASPPYSVIHALLSYENKASVHYAFAPAEQETQSPLVGLRIFGKEGEIYLENEHCGCVNLSLRNGSHQVLRYSPDEGYFHGLIHFYNALRLGETSECTLEKTFSNVQMIFSVLRALHHEKTRQTARNYRRRK